MGICLTKSNGTPIFASNITLYFYILIKMKKFLKNMRFELTIFKSYYIINQNET